MTEIQTEAEWVGKPEVTDQVQILKEYQKLLLGTNFEDLDLNEYQQQALQAYMKAAADGSYGAQIAQKLPGWSLSWVCTMHKAKRLMGCLLKDLKQKRSPQIRARAQKRVFELTSIPPVKTYSLSEAVQLKCTGLNINRLKERGVTETQVRKMRGVTQGIEAGESFGSIAARVHVPEIEVRRIAKILKEAEQIKV
ncbi:hypothetical protein RG963_06770 [Methanosarcina sp. Z-7115]|uniref:Uncharacterized protein n=1 Tax=Methanosarcina baikalica TaxID=3073890 RepID=A0ABU2D0H0_9EURY|nr:hypothetical protein [Methanosarcina sp. Z-7115]MDR7665485.1 hypothetical protein [Methanosarcina sp. Z-7115]